MKMSGTAYVRQHDTRDCAAACLASVCNLYGIKMPMVRMREFLQVDKNGSSMYALSKTAENLGFITEVLQGEWHELFQEITAGKIHLPAICHMHIDGLEHFVLVKKCSEKAVWIFDPGKGHVKYTADLFREQWTGYVLDIYPTGETEKRDYRGKMFRRYVEILADLKWKFVKILLLSFLIAGSSVVYSYAYQQIIDQFVLRGADTARGAAAGYTGLELLLGQAEQMLQHLPYLFAIMIFLVFVQFILALIRGCLLADIGRTMDTELSGQYIQKLLRLPFSYFQQWETGEIMGRYQDMNSIRDAISGSVLTITFDSVMAVAGIVILVRISRPLFLVVLLMVTVYLLIVLMYRRPLRHINRTIMENDAQVTSGIKEGIDGIAAVKLFSQEKKYGKKMMLRIENFITSCYKGSILYISQSSLLSVVQGTGMVAVLWMGTDCVLQGEMTLGTLFLFVSLMSYFVSPVQSLIGLQPQLQEAWIAADRLNDVLEASSEDLCHEGSMETPELNGEIRYQNVSFRTGDSVESAGRTVVQNRRHR